MTHRKLREELERLLQSYETGPVGGDCEDEYDFGFAAGMTCVYGQVVEDLKALLVTVGPTGREHGKRNG